MSKKYPLTKNLRKQIAKKETWEAYYDLSAAYLNNQEYSKALNTFLRYLELRPKWEPNSCGNHLRFMSHDKNFKIIFEKFKDRSLEKKILKNYYFIGIFLFHAQCYEEAIRMFNLLLDEREDRNYLLGLGASLHANENFEEAIDAYKRAYELDEHYNKVYDDKLSFLISASSYDDFHLRIGKSRCDTYGYKRQGGSLSNFILLSPWETECLYRYASNAKHGIVEIGRARGGSTLLFSMSNSKVNIFSIDICNAYDEYLNALFRVLKCGQNVNLMVGDANYVHKTIVDTKLIFDFLFIDGDHSYQACLDDITTWYPSLMPGGIVVFHDTDQISVFNAIGDFARNNQIEFIVPPSPTPRGWENQNGSLCIARKPIEK